jgi:hypothetical protein
MGFFICGYWLTQVASGFLYLGLATIEGDSYISWHIIAELLTGLLSIISAFLILGRHSLSWKVVLFTCGLLFYTGLNSIGWGMYNDPSLLAIFIISSLGALYGFFFILAKGEI